MLFSDRCQVCEDGIGTPCLACQTTFVKAPTQITIPNIKKLSVLFRYESTARDMIRAIKFNNRRACMRWLSFNVAQLVGDQGVDAICHVPSRSINIEARGFDHTEILAKSVSRWLGIRHHSYLKNVSSRNQAGLSKSARAENAKFESMKSPPARVLLIDDIVTTGTTLSAAARALKQRGDCEVFAAVAAATPYFPAA